MIVPPHMPSEPSTRHPRRHHTDRMIPKVFKTTKPSNLKNHENHQKHDFSMFCQNLTFISPGCLWLFRNCIWWLFFGIFDVGNHIHKIANGLGSDSQIWQIAKIIKHMIFRFPNVCCNWFLWFLVASGCSEIVFSTFDQWVFYWYD